MISDDASNPDEPDDDSALSLETPFDEEIEFEPDDLAAFDHDALDALLAESLADDDFDDDLDDDLEGDACLNLIQDLGIDLDAQWTDPQARPMPIVTEGGKPIAELF